MVELQNFPFQATLQDVFTIEDIFFSLWQHCDHCAKRKWGEEKPKRCAGCRVVVYCNRECQKAAWPAHK